MRIDAPFTAEQVHNLNQFQSCGGMHPFTCHNSAHGSLIATEAGWICQMLSCDYTQNWAHDFMADGSAVSQHKAFVESLDRRRTAPHRKAVSMADNSERDSIVAWLRDRKNNTEITPKERSSAYYLQMVGFLELLAAGIERGDHLATPTGQEK